MKEHTVDFFFTIALFLFFMAVGLGSVVVGAGIYRDIAATMERNYDIQTSIFYIEEKVRQNTGVIAIKTVGDQESLVLQDDYEGELYETWIFLGKGKLREVTVPAGTEVSPGDGQSIMDIKDLELEIENGLLSIELETQGGSRFSSAVSLGGDAL
ncbi:MAG: DUF4860 domain-containing protein [Bacillota bacterium]|nr:DUF4860 domain-containing protein [Bacillota bacterium]